ncbi:MAG: DUF2141 domain-containing protein [Bacteroidales bacterium]
MIKKAPCLIIVVCLLLLTAPNLFSQNVEVTVTGIRSEKGQIAIGIFHDEESFRREEAYLEIQFPKKDIRDGVMTVSFSLEPGIYGLSLLDDENSNSKMEYNFLGIPKEGFGFSGYYHTGITRPKFEDFRFTVVQGQEVKITVRMKYF